MRDFGLLIGACLLLIVIGFCGAAAIDHLFPPKVIKVRLCLDPVDDPGRCARESPR